MEPPPYRYFFIPFSRVLPESTRPQSAQPEDGPHLYMNIKTKYIVLMFDHLSLTFRSNNCHNNTQGIDNDTF